MHILGHGIDIVEVARIAGLLQDPAQDFMIGAFSELERQLVTAPHARAQHYAGRLAAKEAVVKALGIGFSQDVGWSEVEVARAASGASTVALSGRALEMAVSLGVTRWLVSISHSDAYAVASAIALAD